MEITYKSKRLEKVCTNARSAEKEYGYDMAEKLHLRMDQIGAAESVEELIQGRVGRCHALTQNRKGQYAMDLVQPHRLVFEKIGDSVQVVRIVEIVDYH